MGPVDVTMREAPRDDKAHGLALARSDRDLGREGAVLGELLHVARARRVVAALGQRAGLGEVFPEQREIIEPLAAIVEVLMLYIGRVGRDGDTAAMGFRFGLGIAIGH